MKSNIGNDRLLQAYARTSLLRMDSQADQRVIDAFLDDVTFLSLARVFDSHLLNALVKFRDAATANASKPASPMPATLSATSSATSAGQPAIVTTAAPTPNVDFDLRAVDAVPSAAPPSSTPDQASAEALPVADPVGAVVTEPSQSVIAFRLPNSRAGDHYSQAFAPLKPLPQPIVFTDIKLPDDMGLEADLTTGTISGTPASAGEFAIPIVFHFDGEASPRLQTTTVLLLVNPNPKLMWKNLPSDATDLYWKADEQCSAVIGPDLRVIAASKRGRSHAHVGSFRDDDYVIGQLPDAGWTIAIVSDGAGSAKFSRRGAQLICQEAAAHLTRVLNGDAGQMIIDATAAFHAARTATPLDVEQIETKKKILKTKLYLAVAHGAHHAAKAIQTELAAHPELNPTTKDFSSTAIISLSRRFEFGTLCAVYWVGDGAVGAYSKASGITLLGDVDSGEFSGQTRFLDGSEVTPEALWKRTHFVLADDLTAFILMTDGVSDAMFDTEANLARRAKWDELWEELDRATGISANEPGGEQRLLAWLDFWSQGNHDDRTIAIVYPAEQSVTQLAAPSTAQQEH